MKKILYLFAFVAVLLVFIVFVSYTVKTNGDSKKTEEVVQPVVPEEKEEVVTPEPTEGGAFKMSINNPATLNPLTNKDNTVDAFLGLMYEGLVALDQEQKPSMVLAESISEDVKGTYLTITLRSGVTWHDGTPFTAEDVVFTVDAIKALGEESMYVKQVENISYAKLVDEKTVEILLKRRYSGAKYALTFPILPKHIFAGKDMNDENINPVGTGPYQFSSFVPMQELVLSKSNVWHDGFVYIKEVHGLITRDEDAKLASLEAGISNGLYTDKVDWSKFSSREDWRVNDFTTYFYDFIGFNFNNSLLQDQTLRQTLIKAVNRENIIKEQLLGYGVLVDAPMHPESWLNNEELVAYPYDEEGAKVDLEEAGYLDSNSDGILEKDGTPLKFELLVSTSDSTRVKIANMIKEDLAKVGIEVTVTTLDPETFKTRIDSDSFDLFYGGWQLSSMVDLTFAFATDAPGNFINYSSPTMDELLSNAYTAVDDATMKESYGQLLGYIHEEVPYMSLFFRKNALVTSKEVYGDVRPLSGSLYNNIENWYIGE